MAGTMNNHSSSRRLGVEDTWLNGLSGIRKLKNFILCDIQNNFSRLSCSPASCFHGGGVKAQDPISNQTPFGAYTGGNQNVIINNDPFFFSNTSNANEIDPTGKNNFTGGDSNKIRNITSGDPTRANISYGKNNFVRDSRFSLAVGKDNFIREADPGIALGEDNKIDGGLLNVDNLISIGRNTQNFQSESIILGFGANNNRLTQAGERSITLGTYNESTDEPFNTLNIRPPSSIGAFTAPVVGIGTIAPNAKLKIVNRGATDGENNNNPSVALRVERFRNLQSNIELFNVRDDGAAGFNIPANPNRPRAPYQFESTGLQPFRDENGNVLPGGEANIVQNYSNFPNFQDAGPNPNGENAKWLALGERPPGDGSKQVAYGLANVWNNAAGNFILLDQTPQNQEEASPDVKDLAITFQDVGPNGGLTDDQGRNLIRFLFRNSQPIEGSGATGDPIYELMSLEPTGEVAVGDYSDNALDPEATRFEVKANSNTDCNSADCDRFTNNGDYDPVTIFEVLKNGSNTNRGDEVLSINDAGRVGIGLDNPNSQFEVTTSNPLKPGPGGWSNPSDRRLKKNIENYQDGLDQLMEIKPVWFQYNSKMEHANTDEKYVGVIAQETKKVAPYMVEKSYQVNGESYYSFNYTAFTYMLINAVQEQQKQLKEEKVANDSLRQVLKNQQEQLNNQQEQLDKQQEQIVQLRERLNQLAQQKEGNANRFKKSENINEKTVSISGKDGQKQAMLLQNRPNPYSGETIIPYYLPKDFETANILITNTNGQMIKRVNLEQPGKGELTLRTKGLNAGQYFYSLTVDGQKIQTRKMVKSRK